MQTKRFDVSDVLSVATPRLVSNRHMEGVYDILNWMTDDNLFTHQLPRAARQCETWLLRWFPELANANAALGALDDLLAQHESNPGEACRIWIERLVAIGLPTHYDVPRVPADHRQHVNPLEELAQMVGPEKIIVVTPPVVA